VSCRCHVTLQRCSIAPAPKLSGTEKLLPSHHLQLKKSFFPYWQRVGIRVTNVLLLLLFIVIIINGCSICHQVSCDMWIFTDECVVVVASYCCVAECVWFCWTHSQHITYWWPV